MSPQDLPFDVLELLQRRITGIDELAALLLVRSEPERRWAASTVAALLERSESWALPALESLCEAELLASPDDDTGEPRFSYRPAPALESVVTTLARLYEERRADILRVLNDNAVDRIRAAAAKTFKGAFEGSEKQAKKRNGGNGHRDGQRNGHKHGKKREGGPLRAPSTMRGA